MRVHVHVCVHVWVPFLSDLPSEDQSTPTTQGECLVYQVPQHAGQPASVTVGLNRYLDTRSIQVSYVHSSILCVHELFC